MTALDDSPVVSLAKEPGTALEVRPPATMVVRQRWVAARQATARATVLVADQPVVARTVAVGRQLPRATWRLSVCAPRGARRATTLLAGWLHDSGSAELLAKHAEAGEGESYAKVARARVEANLPGRRRALAAVATPLVLVGLAWWAPHIFAGLLAAGVFLTVIAMAPRHDLKAAGWSLAFAGLAAFLAWRFGPALAALIPQPPAWVWIVAGGFAVLGFGWLGRHEDRPLVEMPPVMVAHKAPPVTAPMVIDALCSLGNSKMKDADSVRVLMDPHRAGPGVQLDLELPKGVGASFVMENRERFAGALRRELGTVWPSRGPRHPSHLTLFVADEVMAEAEQEPWPLLRAGEVDIFTPVPAFTDQLGRWVPVTLAYASAVIGAAPRMGKTFVLRELLLIAGLDRRTKVIALDGKGTGDLAPCALFAHAYVRGARINKPENIEKVLGIVRWLLDELGRRADIIDGLPDEECPESKVTSELIDAHPELDLGPIVVGVDETQSYFSYGNKSNKEHKVIREEIRDGFVELMKLGPAVGIWVILSTQIVRESTIPTEAAAVAVIRFALKLEGGWEPNDRILGTGAFTKGIDATMFDFEDKGIGILKAEGQRAVTCRSVFGLDVPTSRQIAERCRRMRLADGTLTGDAGDDGIEDAELVVDIVADAELVMRRASRATAPYSEVVEWLRELRPENYADLNVAELSARIRSAGIESASVWQDGRSHKGLKLADLQRRELR